jgi:hypothetical protein
MLIFCTFVYLYYLCTLVIEYFLHKNIYKCIVFYTHHYYIGDEHYLDLRAFPEDIKLAVWEKQNHICPICGREYDFEFMEGDHITPWREGGRTVVENCQMLCRECNRRKGAK